MNTITTASPDSALDFVSSPKGTSRPAPADFSLGVLRRTQERKAVNPRQRIFSIAVAVGVQVIFLSAWLYGTVVRPPLPKEALTIVDIVAEKKPREVEPPPPPPKMLPVPVLTITPPSVNIITEPAPNAPTAVVAPVAASPPPPPRATGNGTAVLDFQTNLLRHLNRHKRYPPGARARKEQGVVYIRFAMDREGNVLSATIERTCKHPILDEEGLALVRRAQPLPRPPLELPGDEVELVVPVEFALK